VLLADCFPTARSAKSVFGSPAIISVISSQEISDQEISDQEISDQEIRLLFVDY